ncbi:GNAT family N-acetyltransferase [Legionella pneumophila serogroup 1]|uniref:GNAT family N-acetyltransferase n=1 Tax=Legionella pneumophila TaxID=446 RepID=UPI00101F3D3D|nr:GNAT family N-acetyltransferase [Legionella pneumophila]HAT9682595.1 GNAT family N-acetyltransferase [Legionella pneumophila subsp. pneumophila]MCH9100157.1 GNAT family N-acetyltransferase [Legionella pneumophila serogroup 1]MCH9112292.1 GNAT family N-acetyltransferase [Legionella pneumophila serogroup 1]MDW9159567.1 GNAT family N-acetyltransferase [Legionella pneumophila]RYX29864.1 GNAT family N-acetyltransferase [Legionella pneumophila]
MIALDPSFAIFEATAKESEYIRDEIVRFNIQQVPLTQKEILFHKNYVIKEDNVIIAGITAKIYMWGILFIDILFIAESHRKKQLGTYLLNKVEDEARKVGATLAHLDTFDFQAKDFYLKHGYEVFGVLDNCPSGHQRFYLKKAL